MVPRGMVAVTSAATAAKPILGATAWANNSDLIADVARLGWIKQSDTVLDPTYGRGNWWKAFRPDTLIAHDLQLDGVDFRDLPEPAGSVDVVAFDPPYIAQGGRDSSTMQLFLGRYGFVDSPTTRAGVNELMFDGCVEAFRVLRPQGILLLKCMNYVNGGRYRLDAYDLLADLLQRRFRCEDEFIHLRRPGPQPARDRQHHARRNYSHLFVLRKAS